jgi:proline iminopeptidase
MPQSFAKRTLMKSIGKFILTLILGLHSIPSQSQSHQSAVNKTGALQPLPGLQDWFLSTGNWQNDPQLYVREFGTGPDTIMMLHGGWGGEHSELVDVVKELGQQYHFIFYDQRGSLRSPFPDSLITFSQHIADLERLRKELKVDKLHIVAHSMGAVLACAYASQYPQHIKKLTLLAPAPLKNPLPEGDKELQRKANSAQQAFMERPAVTQEMNKYNLNRTTPDLSSLEATSKFRIQFAKRMLYDVSKWPSLMGGRALYKGQVFELTARTYPPSGWDYFQQFKRQAYPVSIIIGDHDFLDFGNHLTRKWAGDVPRIKLTTIENAGHLIWIDQPKAFSKELQQHLKL